MDRWMDGWTDGWLNGWIDGWTDGWMDGAKSEQSSRNVFAKMNLHRKETHR